MFNKLKKENLDFIDHERVSFYYNMQSLSLHSDISLFNRNRKKRKYGNCCRRIQGTGCHGEFTETAGDCEAVL